MPDGRVRRSFFIFKDFKRIRIGCLLLRFILLQDLPMITEMLDTVEQKESTKEEV